MKRTMLSALLLGVLLAACSVKEKYVVLSDVPPNPTVTVIPSTGSKEDVADADVVIGLLVDCGVKTVLRPVMVKERTEYDGTGSSSGIAASGGRIAVALGDASSKGGQTTSVDEVSLLKETTADYVFYVRHTRQGPQVVLVKRESGQILHVGQIGTGSAGSSCCLSGTTYEVQSKPQDKMRQLLVSAGILR